MKLTLRIARLEKKVDHLSSEFEHLTDDALRAKAVTLASDLQASGALDPDTVVFLTANGLWRGGDSISASPPLPLNGPKDGDAGEVQ